jgi:hypothetical protein
MNKTEALQKVREVLDSYTFSQMTAKELDQLASLIADKEEEWPKKEDEYYCPSVVSDDLHDKYFYSGDGTDQLLKHRNLICRTKEEAVARAKVMIEAIGGEV